jgi:hypothetical protein
MARKNLRRGFCFHCCVTFWEREWGRALLEENLWNVKARINRHNALTHTFDVVDVSHFVESPLENAPRNATSLRQSRPLVITPVSLKLQF